MVENLQETIQSRSATNHLEPISKLECILPHIYSVLLRERDVLHATLMAHVTYLTLRVFERPPEWDRYYA